MSCSSAASLARVSTGTIPNHNSHTSHPGDPDRDMVRCLNNSYPVETPCTPRCGIYDREKRSTKARFEQYPVFDGVVSPFYTSLVPMHARARCHPSQATLASLGTSTSFDALVRDATCTSCRSRLSPLPRFIWLQIRDRTRKRI